MISIPRAQKKKKKYKKKIVHPDNNNNNNKKLYIHTAIINFPQTPSIFNISSPDYIRSDKANSPFLKFGEKVKSPFVTGENIIELEFGVRA